MIGVHKVINGGEGMNDDAYYVTVYSIVENGYVCALVSAFNIEKTQ